MAAEDMTVAFSLVRGKLLEYWQGFLQALRILLSLRLSYLGEMEEGISSNL